MVIIVRAPLMADRIKDSLDSNTFDGVVFSFVHKKGMEMLFTVSGDNLDELDVIAITKQAIKDTEYGKGLYFSVIKG